MNILLYLRFLEPILKTFSFVTSRISQVRFLLGLSIWSCTIMLRRTHRRSSLKNHSMFSRQKTTYYSFSAYNVFLVIILILLIRENWPQFTPSRTWRITYLIYIPTSLPNHTMKPLVGRFPSYSTSQSQCSHTYLQPIINQFSQHAARL